MGKILDNNVEVDDIVYWFDTDHKAVEKVTEEIKSYKGQVLIVHGTADKIVNLDYAKRAVEAYKRTTPEGMDAENRVRFHVIEDGAHMFSQKHDVIAMEYLKEFAG